MRRILAIKRLGSTKPHFIPLPEFDTKRRYITTPVTGEVFKLLHNREKATLIVPMRYQQSRYGIIIVCFEVPYENYTREGLWCNTVIEAFYNIVAGVLAR